MDAETTHEAAQRRLLRRNKGLATGLLVGMAVVFVALRLVPGDGFWLGLGRAASEAAIVGALADWFAVTALFRHPLGLPIPHTAIVPRSKDRIGEGLGSFVERNFLDPATVSTKLRQLQPSTLAARWLTRPGNAEALSAWVVDKLPGLVATLEDRELRGFFAQAVGEQLREFRLSPLLGRALRLLLAKGQHQPLIERLVSGGLGYVDRNEERLKAMVSERSKWWIPSRVDQRVAESIANGVRELLVSLERPDSDARLELEAGLHRMAENLEAQRDKPHRVEEIKAQLLSLPEVAASLGSLWDSLRETVIADAQSPDSKTRRAITTALQSLGRALSDDPAMRERLDGMLEAAVVRGDLPWRRRVGQFITEVVHGWDTRTVVDRMELAVGPDLQYVRISGTIVAALVGSALYLVSEGLG